MTEERRNSDGQLAAIMDLMAANHSTTISMIDQNRNHFDEKVDGLLSRFDREIPDGHGKYHHDLIASAARQQAFREAVKHKVGGWATVGVLAALAAWGWDWITAHFKP